MQTKKILIGLMAGSLATMCVGCGTPTPNLTETTTAPASTAATTSIATENKEVNYNPGEVIRYGNEEVTITNVVKGYNLTAEDSSSGNVPSYKPSDGNQYIKVTVNIKNVSSTTAALSSSEFKIQNSQGQLTGTAGPNYYLKDKFQTLSIVSGGTSTGSMIFEAPINDSGIKLVYTPVYGKGMLFIKL